MRRVVIFGSPGAGKSTLSYKLAAITGLPIIHLDRHFWKPGWVRTESDTWRVMVQELTNQPVWIMDGNYSGTLDLRLGTADTLIHLDYPTHICMCRVLFRIISTYGKQRSDVAEGCAERFDLSFLRFVWNYRRDNRPRDMVLMADFKGTTHRFTHPGELDAFMEKLSRMN